ncbi:DUF1850 domain-containing protein [Natronobeatus ordinarius]|uniref:DUF1850 domain-containing protein n=1 Tax=Natronobeatus ordinarius TaxID=2963433 RepID=UPI0020CD9354|nr:DUF1850 domain-containing protein [Natronobeatus ordinarius]
MSACKASRILRVAGASILVGAVFLLAVAAAAPTITTVQLTDRESGETLAVYPLEEGEEFEIRYVHSFEKTPIHETYVVDGSDIVQVREAYAYHAAGLEHSRETYREGNMTVSEFERELGTFSVRVASTTEQDLVIDGRERPLQSYAESGSTIQFSAERTNYAVYRLLSAAGRW